MILAACGPTPTSWQSAPPLSQSAPLLASLPKPAAVDTVSFTSMLVCERCHTPGVRAMRDVGGRDISPYGEFQTSMLSLSARDPYFLAAVRRELQHRPGHATEALCISCHAPVGYAEDPRLTLDDLEHGSSPAAALARDGVGCLGCHALEDGALRRDRVVFGVIAAPLVDAMVAMSKTTPVRNPAIATSAACASCHTVTIGALVEQGTYLEWQAARGAAECQGCHQPSGDPEVNDPAPIATPISTRPLDAPSRGDYRHHAIRGGNAYLLGALARQAAWLNTGVDLTRAVASTKRFLGTAAALTLTRGQGGVHVRVDNLTGHKLPTGFPSRRMWLHVIALDAQGAIVFESGSHRKGALLIGGRGIRIDGAGTILPHRTRIDGPEQVAVWEAVPVDARGAPTHVMFGAVRFAKDDRILPRGWTAPDAAVAPVGVDGDPDFAPGSDGVDYALPRAATRVEVELLYQSIPPETLESYAASDGPEAARFLAIASTPPLPQLLASSSLALDATP